MQNNLIIVESPAKAKTIEKFLDDSYKVLSSRGHIRDLKNKELSVDIKNDFKPEYVISPEKIELVKQLKKATEKARMIWLALDGDREGEAIAWHLYIVLGLTQENCKRIVFHEITKDAIFNALENPRSIDSHLVNAQQARRILDRIVGFELSPILWKKIMPSLSAGRVQSVAVRLISEKEKEINNFKVESFFRIQAQFLLSDKKTLVWSELNKKFRVEDEAKTFLETLKQANFSVKNVEIRYGKKSPAPPFTTSTLQQESFRKAGFSVSQTMTIAQKLYEAGKITYMRTDSLHLSHLALQMAEKVIIDKFGNRYLNIRQYKTKSKVAQEAHEAIRPTYLNRRTIEGSLQEKRLYQLIWERTIASQMAESELERIIVTIELDNNLTCQFQIQGEIIKFHGFLQIYLNNDENISKEKMKPFFPVIKQNEILNLIEATSSECLDQVPSRYTEASLVRKLENLGIGRPSTYAPIISTIQNRGYISKRDNVGEKKLLTIWELKDQIIAKRTVEKIIGAEKHKLIPTDSGLIVNKFLIEHFPSVLEYNFTADLEKEFDKIASGKLKWTETLNNFYTLFHPIVEKVSSVRTEHRIGERVLGMDNNGKSVSVKIGRFGPFVQIGLTGDKEKPQFASLIQGQSIQTITLAEALDLFKLPRKIGELENKPIFIGVSKFGPYIKFNNIFISIPKEYNQNNITFLEAEELIKKRNEQNLIKILRSFSENDDLQILNGRFGPYIVYKGMNYKLPKKAELDTISYGDVMSIVLSNQKQNLKQKKFLKIKKWTS